MTIGKKKNQRSRKNKYEINIKPAIIIFAVIICIAVAVIIACVKLGSVHTPPVELPLTKSLSQGVDVSEHNGKIDWQKLAEEFDFAFIRVGYRGYSEKGIISEDKYARKNLSAANETGMPIGIYFYSQATNEDEAREEADFALKIARKYDISLPIIIDFEYPHDSKGNETGRLSEAMLSPTQSADVINAFTERIEEKGYYSGVYASSSVFAHRIDTDSLSDSTFIWVADYNSHVTFDVDYTIWQYTERGKSSAISSKYVDMNYWYN